MAKKNGGLVNAGLFQGKVSYDKDSKRFHRYLVSSQDDQVVGTLYLAKGSNPPKEMLLTLLRSTK